MHNSSILNFMLILLALGLLMDWYAISGLRTLSATWTSRSRRRWLIAVYCIISFGVTVLFLTGLYTMRSAQGMTPYHEWILSLFLALLVTKIFYSVAMLLGDLGRLIAGLIRLLSGSKAKGTSLNPGASSNPAASPTAGTSKALSSREPRIPSRRKFIVRAAGVFAAIPFFSFMYAMLKGKYDYKVHRQTLWFDDLPDVFDGFTITQLSDIHSGSFDSTTGVKKGIELAIQQQSDLFVFTGDLVNNAAWEIEPWLAHFSRLKAPFGQFSVLGNHDYGDYIEWKTPEAKVANLEKLKQHHADLGYRLLLDEHVRIEKQGQSITLLGVQNWGRGFVQHGDLDKALAGTDPSSVKILLSHDPTHWEEIVRYHPTRIHLTLSGHTHGAQFGVETDKWRWSPVQYRYLDWAGPAEHNDRHLYVNRGFGFLAFSGRLGIWPEITVITLKKKQVN